MFGSHFYLANYQSNFAHLMNADSGANPAVNTLNGMLQAPNADSGAKGKRSLNNVCLIQKPLIAFLGISEYNKNILCNLECVIHDFENIEYAFHNIRGYSMIYFDKNNQIVHQAQESNTTSEIKTNEKNKEKTINIKTNSKAKTKAKSKRKKKIKNVLKLRWKDSEIFDFNDELLDCLENEKNDYDCLMYIISCHGDSGGVIYDSEGNKIPLISIFEQFNNQNCVQLRNKAKIYIVEACRGGERTKRFANSSFGDIFSDSGSGSGSGSSGSGTGNSVPKLFQTEESEIKEDNTAVVASIAINIGGVKQKNKKKGKENEKQKEKEKQRDEKETKAGDTEQDSNDLKDLENGSPNGSQDGIISNVFSKYNYNREIYANTEGYAVVEPYTKGAYLIRSLTKAFANDKIFSNDFDTIMIHTRNILLKLMGKSTQCGAQVIDDRSNIPQKIVFESKLKLKM